MIVGFEKEVIKLVKTQYSGEMNWALIINDDSSKRMRLSPWLMENIIKDALEADHPDTKYEIVTLKD